MGASALTGAMLAYAVRGRSSQVFGPSVYRGLPGRRSIALTFDDGPSEQSLELVDYLAEQNIPATFFQCGVNILRHPEIARQIYAAGHEIGNHTYSHSRLCPRLGWHPTWHSPAYIDWEFTHAQEIIQSEVGVAPTLLRAPYGLRWFGLRGLQRRLGLLGVMWTVIGRDWELPARAITSLVLGSASPAGIVCLHDGRDIQTNPDVSEMLKAVKSIVPVLKDKGYHFETVSQLLRPVSRHSQGPFSISRARKI